MKLEKLKQAKDIEKDILEKKDLLENVKKLLPIPAAEKNVEIKIRGTKFELPKSIFTAQLKKKVKDMEDEVALLESDLNKL